MRTFRECRKVSRASDRFAEPHLVDLCRGADTTLDLPHHLALLVSPQCQAAVGARPLSRNELPIRAERNAGVLDGGDVRKRQRLRGVWFLLRLGVLIGWFHI